MYIYLDHFDFNSKQNIDHLSLSISFSLFFLFSKKDPKFKTSLGKAIHITRAQVWKASCTNKDGQIDEVIQPVIQRIVCF